MGMKQERADHQPEEIYDGMGIVYLLHFDQRLGRRRHYLGYTTTLERRLKDHRLGRGGKTTALFRKAGIGFELAAQWAGSPEDERRFKAKNLASLCPICKEGKMTVWKHYNKPPMSPRGRWPCPYPTW